MYDFKNIRKSKISISFSNDIGLSIAIVKKLCAYKTVPRDIPWIDAIKIHAVYIVVNV